MTDVLMPQMGESIAEGTVTRWLKKVGDSVERDQPLLEISTDKVDAEIPAPASGVLTEVLVDEGATVAIQTVLARIAEPNDAVATPQPPTPPTAPPPLSPQAVSAPPPVPSESASPAEPAPPPTPPRAEAVSPEPPPPGEDEPPAPEPSPVDELRRSRSSPLVRRIASENRVDLSAIRGTGLGGRVTKQDILEHIQKRLREEPSEVPPPVPVPPPATAPATAPAPPASPSASTPPPPVPSAAIVGPRDRVVPMSPIRRRTAEHMAASRRTAAHATTLFEIDMTRIEQLRVAHRRAFQEQGVPLTFLPFILKATVDALSAHPILNARLDGDRIVYHHDINVGIAVALDRGLIVPVIRNAEEKNVLALARSVFDLVERARTKHLRLDEVQGGTFTVTNPGVFGSLFGTPIIHQPQLAILATGVVEKRPVVREDAIAVRSMAYFALSFDHRVIDGADADRFMAQIKRDLQDFDESAL